MLNLSVAMMGMISLLKLFLTGLLASLPFYLVYPQVDTPRNGDVVQGVVTIQGSTDLTGFQSAEVSYAYEQGEEKNWFLIYQSSEPQNGGTLAVWDTTMIADGNYILKVQAFLEDGSTVETIVTGLRVRNYSPVETSTFLPGSLYVNTPTITPEILVTPRITPTNFPANPAELTQVELLSSARFGILFACGCAILGGGYLWWRKGGR
jgi:hypothetical protein